VVPPRKVIVSAATSEKAASVISKAKTNFFMVFSSQKARDQKGWESDEG
jgi:hypothetical protein